MKVLTQYRAWLLRVVGDYQSQVLGEVETNCTGTQRVTEPCKEQLREIGLRFDQHVDFLLKRLWDDLVEEGQLFGVLRLGHQFTVEQTSTKSPQKYFTSEL